MATPLTGSSVASTYTGLLKTSDNASLSGTLKSVSDGGGTDSALQLSTTAANIVGTLNVTGATGLASSLAVSGLATIGSTLGVTGATNLSSNLTVSGATNLSSTLAVTGATTLSSLAATGNISTSAGNLSVFGSITQTNSASSNSIAGSLTVSSSLTCNGNVTFFGNVSFSNPLTINSTLNVTGATVISNNLTVTGSIASSSSVSGTSLSASGNLTVNGNTTIGNAGTDLLTVNANVVTFPNITTQNVDTDTDKVIILDSTGRLRASNSSQFVQNSTNAPQCKQLADTAISVKTASTTGSGTDVISVVITPRSTGSRILVSAVINYSFGTGVSKNCVFRLTRNGTEIGTSTYVSGLLGIASASYEDGEVEAINNVKIEFLDNPNTSSAVTYKIHVYGTGSMYMNQNFFASSQQSTTSTITAQEYFA